MSDVERFLRFCESDFGASVMDREAAYLSDCFESDDRVLDVGCGIGSIEQRLPGYDIVGIDMSEEMVQAARSRVGRQFIVGDGRTLPITTDSVNAVFFVATLEFIREVETVLSEAVRVLEPDGVMAALILNTRSTYVRSNLERDGSYFQQMVHRDTVKLASTIDQYVDTDQEYFLGIRDRTVFETDDPEEAAILAVRGQPLT
jgi:ubiquinone/menaquinone biosynthesis C-methylase UbiE